jgi:hypothetical protein
MTEQFSKARLAKNLEEYPEYNYIAVDEDRDIFCYGKLPKDENKNVWQPSINSSEYSIGKLPENVDFNWKETLCTRADIENCFDAILPSHNCQLNGEWATTKQDIIHPQDVFEYLHLSDRWRKIKKEPSQSKCVAMTENETKFMFMKYFNINIDMKAFEEQSVWERPVDRTKNIGKIGWFWDGDEGRQNIGILNKINNDGRFGVKINCKSEASLHYYLNFRLLTDQEKKDMF